MPDVDHSGQEHAEGLRFAAFEAPPEICKMMYDLLYFVVTGDPQPTLTKDAG